MSSDRPQSIRDLLAAHPRRNRINLSLFEPSETHGIKRRWTEKHALDDEKRIMDLQDCLYAEHKHAILIVLQGMDTSGKDGTIRHILRGLNPQGVRVISFKEPTPTEMHHDFLWRIKSQLPHPGKTVIFNRSHYEDVLISKVRQLFPPEEIERRYDLINQFEADLVSHDTTLIKLFLHISAEEQRERLLARLGSPEKHWKFSPNDLTERRRWTDYQAAYATAIGRCSIKVAPWYIIPSNRKWYRDWAVSQILIETLESLNLTYPDPHLDVKKLKKNLQPGN